MIFFFTAQENVFKCLVLWDQQCTTHEQKMTYHIPGPRKTENTESLRG